VVTHFSEGYSRGIFKERPRYPGLAGFTKSIPFQAREKRDSLPNALDIGPKLAKILFAQSIGWLENTP
jgi:hypothetical protein